ncbi:MAG: Trk system potassium transporter TrkA [Rhizobiales bacterium]|nr:Trk system potassium transporter TrkA [Hyphomicrobiales bacterium]
MKVVICGAGQVGYGIAERLSNERNDVTVIDSSEALIRGIRETLDVRAFVGHGSHPDTLKQAGVGDADMLIAVTLYDEVNMVACQVAHSLFKVPTKIARIRAQSYLKPEWQDLFSREHLPIDVIISPEVEVGEMLLRRLQVPGADDTVLFADGHVAVVGIHCDENCPVVETPLRQLSELFPNLNTVVVGIVRGDSLFVPQSDDAMQVGDLVYVAVERDQIRRALGIFGHEEVQANRVVIAGGGNIGLYVAKSIETLRARAKIKIIESNKDRAIAVADRLQRTVVLNGSALDQTILMEADTGEADIMISLTNNDEVNVLSCVMAKQLGCKRTLALLNNRGYPGLIRLLGIDGHINPRQVTVSKILQHVRRGRIRAVHSVQNGMAEAIEAEALETSSLVGQPLRDLELGDGIRIGAIYRDKHVIIPDGDTKIRAKDRVVIFAHASRVKHVEQMFRVSLDFFG